MAEILHAAGVIPEQTVTSLARGSAIPKKTLQSSMGVGRVSVDVERRLSHFGGFDPADRAWIDLSRPEKERGEFDPCYRGGDTADHFHAMLREIWRPKPLTFRAETDLPEPVDRDFACHEITDHGQTTEFPGDFPLFLDSAFGTLHDDRGVSYGFHCARLRMTIRCPQGKSRLSTRLGRGIAVPIGNAEIKAGGTSSLPSWKIFRPGPASDILDGEYSTQAPLVVLSGYAEGTRVETTLYVDLHEGGISVDPSLGQLSGNKQALLELVCALEVAAARDAAGRVDLCTHALTLTGINDG